MTCLCSSYNPQTFDVDSTEAALANLSFRAADFIKEMQEGAIEGLARSGASLDLYFPALRHMASEVGIEEVSEDMLVKMAIQLGLSAAVFGECLDLDYVD